jgi:hypothetical protein
MNLSSRRSQQQEPHDDARADDHGAEDEAFAGEIAQFSHGASLILGIGLRAANRSPPFEPLSGLPWYSQFGWPSSVPQM